MTFIEVADIYGFFSDMQATLDNLYLDGIEVIFDTTKVLDSNEDPQYRLELWNYYGATKNNGCAFGTPDGDFIFLKTTSFYLKNYVQRYPLNARNSILLLYPVALTIVYRTVPISLHPFLL